MQVIKSPRDISYLFMFSLANVLNKMVKAQVHSQDQADLHLDGALGTQQDFHSPSKSRPCKVVKSPYLQYQGMVPRWHEIIVSI